MTASTNQITPNCYDKKALLGLSLIETFDFLTFQMVIIRFVFCLDWETILGIVVMPRRDCLLIETLEFLFLHCPIGAIF